MPPLPSVEFLVVQYNTVQYIHMALALGLGLGLEVRVISDSNGNASVEVRSSLTPTV